MNEYILNNIDCNFNVEAIMKQLRIKEDSPTREDLEQFVLEAMYVAKPKAYYRVERVESKGEDRVVINGTTFTSRVLRSNLEDPHRVFPFVATCGMEMEEWSHSQDDILKRFWAEALNSAALYMAIKALNRDLAERFQPGKTSMMTPGSLVDWPIREQQHLFRLLGDPSQTIGVMLSRSHLMTPMKSVSGILFPAEDGFEECELCPRKKCSGRRRPYDKGLYERKYGTKKQKGGLDGTAQSGDEEDNQRRHEMVCP